MFLESALSTSSHRQNIANAANPDALFATASLRFKTSLPLCGLAIQTTSDVIKVKNEMTRLQQRMDEQAAKRTLRKRDG